MKIIKTHIIVKYFLPVTAGIEVNISETYSKMVDKGFDITLHTSNDTHTNKNILSETDEYKGIKVKRYSYGILGYWPKIDWKTADMICLHNFNVFPHFFIMLYALMLKIIGQKKFSLFLTPHGGYNPEWSIFPRGIREIKQIYHFTIGTLLINLSVDGMRAVSEWEKSEMLKKGIRKSIIEVIDNGIEDEAYMDVDTLASTDIKDKVKEYGRYIIQIGRIYVIKNYETVIRALVNCPPDVKYIIVGGIEKNYHDDYKNKLDNLIKELKLEDRVLFAGIVRGVDKYYLIRHAKMMVHMALWESFCNVVHEGLSQGLPCLVANNTALPYLIKDGENGFCIPTKDSNEVSKKINYILANESTPEINQMKERNKEYGLRNSWKNVSDNLVSFYIRTNENNKRS